MKKRWKHYLGLALALGLLFLLVLPDPDDVRRAVPAEDLPWAIQVLPDGATRVLGLELGHDTMQAVLDRFGRQVDAALFESEDGTLALEAYYRKVQLGHLTGALVARLSMEPEGLAALRARSTRGERLATGMIRFNLDPADGDVVLTATLDGLTFVPSVNLEEEVVVRLFGEPDGRLALERDAVRLLYPAKGLSITLDPNAKEAFDYVQPGNFAGAVTDNATRPTTGQP